MQRFFMSEAETIEGGTLLVQKGDNFFHLTRSLRVRIGEKLIFCDGKGSDHLCEVREIAADKATLSILQTVPSTGETTCKMRLFQCLAKGDKMDQIVKRCVEMGISEIIPVQSENCVVKLKNGDSGKVERWQKIAHSAAEQSGRGIIPAVHPAVSLEKALEMMAQSDIKFICYENEEGHSIADIDTDGAGSIAFLVGPEGGLSPNEKTKWEQMKIPSVSLGRRILRTENAAAFVLPILQYKLKEI